MSFRKPNLQKIRKNTKNFRAKLSTRIYILPNLLTTGNLFFGFMSVLHSIRGNFTYAAYAIVAAAVFDLLDGRVARMTHSTSKFGSEYDSLCDLMSFGMAPAILMYLWALNSFDRLGMIACFLFLACGALRLARFNVQKEIIGNTNFSGLPIPMAAGIVAGAYLCFQDLGWDGQASIYLLAMTFLLAGVMVSNFPYRSFKDLDFRRRLPFHYLVLGLVLFVVVAYRPEVMIFALFLTYAVLGAVFGALRIGRQPKKNPYQDPYDDEDEDEEDDEIEEGEHSHLTSESPPHKTN